MPITIGESGWAKAVAGHSTNFAKLKMKPALIKYSEESDESRACAKASGAQLSETLSATIRIPSRLKINLTATGNDNLKAHPAINSKLHGNTSKNAALHYRRGGVYEIRHKFKVPVVQQVLAAN